MTDHGDPRLYPTDLRRRLEELRRQERIARGLPEEPPAKPHPLGRKPDLWVQNEERGLVRMLALSIGVGVVIWSAAGFILWSLLW